MIKLDAPIKLEIDNSRSRLIGLSPSEFAAVKKLLSYDIDPKVAFFSGTTRLTTRYLVDARGNFPTGLLHIVNRYLEKIPHSRTDRRIMPKPLARLSMPLDLPFKPFHIQLEAARAAHKSHRGIISAPTGVGKSVIAALIVRMLKVRTLIVVPNLELKRQLTEDFKAYMPLCDVGPYGSDIAIENVDALDIREKHNYDCVIIDEFHHAGAATYRGLNRHAWTGIYYRFGLTATPFRTQDHEKLLLESVLSEVIYRIPFSTAVAEGYIVPVEAYYVDVPSSKPVKGRTWPEVYSELVVNNAKRNAMIHTMLDRLAGQNASTICLVKEIKHGENIVSGVQATIPFIKGENSNNRTLIGDFNKRVYCCIVGTNGVIGEGVDTKPAEFVIIAGLGKSKSQFMQQVGRGVRKFPNKESCKVILFRDASHKYTLTHFKEQVKILKDEYGVIPTKINI